MPIAPIPGIDNSKWGDYSDILQNLMQNRMQQQQFKSMEPLRQAQTEEAKAKAEKSKMYSNLIKTALGNGQQGLPTNQNTMVQSDDNLSKLANFSQNSTNKDQQTALNMAYKLGILKESPEEQSRREMKTSWGKEIGASDVKMLDKWNDQINDNAKVEPVLEHNMQIMANPKFQQMYKNPEYFGYDISYLKRFPDYPEQSDLLTTFGTNTKTLYSSMGSEFKGSFRDFEKKIFDKAIPDELNDTLPQMVAKNKALYALRQLGTKRFTLAQNIVRSSGGEISPSNALEIAKKQINGNDVRNQIESEFKELNEKLKSQKKVNYNESINNNEKNNNLKDMNDNELIDIGKMRIIDSKGKEHIIDRDKLDEAKIIDPKLTVKKVKFGAF